MEILWPPTYFTDGNKTISLFDIYYMAYLSSISYAVILFQRSNGKMRKYVFSEPSEIRYVVYQICNVQKYDKK